MVGHLVRVDRATPLALENVPMGQLGPWLDPVTHLTLSGVSVLVLAAVGISVAARNKISADITNKTGTWSLGRVGNNPRISPTDDFPSLLQAENLFHLLTLPTLLYCSDSTPLHLSVDPHRIRLFLAHTHTHTHAPPHSHGPIIHNGSHPRPHTALYPLRRPIGSSSEAHSPAAVTHHTGTCKPHVNDAEVFAMDRHRTVSCNSLHHFYDNVDALEIFDGGDQQWSRRESIHPSQLSRVALRHWVHCPCYYSAH